MELNEYLEAVIEERLSDLHTVALAKIVSFDNSSMIGSIKPLFSRVLQDGSQISAPVVSGVPVAGVRSGGWTVRIPYKPGDVVLVAYAERAIDTAKNGSEGDPGYNRKHSIDDAVIIGGVLTSASVTGDGVVIEGPSSRVQLSDNGNINIEASGDVSVSSQGDISLNANPGSISITAPVGGVSISGPESSGSW